MKKHIAILLSAGLLLRIPASDKFQTTAMAAGENTLISTAMTQLALDRNYRAPTLTAPLSAIPARQTPKNIILVIGDGMGTGALRLTSLHLHNDAGRLLMEQLPVTGLCHTLSYESEVTDSAAAATALATGFKTKNRRIGLDADMRHITAFTELAQQHGRAVGIITSDSILGATPAGFYAHTTHRHNYREIAHCAATCGYDILLGNANGKAWFLPENHGGKPDDNRHLLAEMLTNGYTEIETHEGLEQAPSDRRILGFMAKGTLDDETTLARLTDAALTRLVRNDQGFFLMVECTIIDAGGHSNNPELTVRGTLQVDWAVKSAVEFAHKRGDTLVLVTADHETGGLTAEMASGKLVFNYATTSHTDMPVQIFAYGPGAELFSGTIDNTAVARKIAELWSLTLPTPKTQPPPAHKPAPPSENTEDSLQPAA